MKGITLIGMPGVGKSTIGKMLAERLAYKFVDLDILIKEKTGRSHADILEKEGEGKLLRLENNYTLGLNFAKTVFSPGGSIVYSRKAMKKLRNETAIVYLKLPLGELRKRLGRGIYDRGIVGLEAKGFDRLFKERSPLYESFAHHIVDCSKLKDSLILNTIIKTISF